MNQPPVAHQPTLTIIGNQHKVLLLQMDRPGEVDLEPIQTFLETLAQAGATIQDAEDRSSLHELIRYWSNIINEKTGAFPVVQLQPFDGTQAVSRTDNHALSKMDTAVSLSSTQQPALKGRQTLWNWLQLLIIPVVLIVGAVAFSLQQSQISLQVSQQQRQNELNIAATQYANDQHLAEDQQLATVLQMYLDRMSDLLLNPNIHTRGQQGDDIRLLARTRTLTTLQQLDGPRKAIVLQFLYSGGLIKRQDPTSSNVDPIVNLDGADLSATYLSNANLSGADLTGVNLSRANLKGADLTNVAWKNSTCPDGTNSDTNGSGSCVSH